MKRLIFGIIIILLFPILGLSEDVHDILTNMERVGNYKTAYMKSEMIITRHKKVISKMEMLSVEKRGEVNKELIRFLAPPRLKGTAILVVGKNVWYYNNRTKRVRRLGEQSKKGSMMGTSFTYEDITTEYSKDFDGEIVKVKRNYYIIKLYPKTQDKSYKYLIVEVNKKTYIPEKVEYYNEEDLKYKQMYERDIEKIDGKVFPLTIIMEDLNTEKETYIKIDKESVKFDIPIDDEFFSIRNLKNPMGTK